MGLNQSSPVQAHENDRQAQHHWNKLDEKHYQAYIENVLHGNSQGKPIILGIYNRWLTHHDQKPLSTHDFESMVNDLSARAAKYAMTAKKAADSKAKAENQTAIQTFEREEGNLEERAIVYFHGKGDSLKMHYYVPDTMDYIHGEFQKWTKFRLVDFYPFETTKTHEKADAELQCFVELQQTKHNRQNILLTWAEFINNFTPFNEEDSKSNTHGAYFKPKNWHFNKECIKTVRTHYTPKQGRDSRQSRQSSLDQERYSQYGGDPG
jgi:hypothetical protein